MKKNNLLYIAVILLFTNCVTQNTLTKNYTTVNQGITRDSLSIKNIQPIFTFPKELNENSGMEVDQDFIWTFNDSGGKNSIYKVDFKGNIVQEVEIQNAKNRDWEDITSDENFIYVGDFGNNNGNRQDLTIYKINKSTITTKPQQSVVAETITFEYNNRNDFSKKPYQHDFDCESMFIYKNQIHLLTKAWKTGISSHYVLPTVAGNYKAQYLEKLNTQGFLTAADINGKQVSAVQYTREGEVVLWNFSFDKNSLLFNNPIQATYLGNTSELGQIEGIMFFKNKLYISGEEMNGIPPTLYLIQR
ncbi:hypothetical protein UJ101_00808 [Flavobacteriaceae bacterium UJ101]|nr:hypothetical protein UJ101_00808 [Flavobacteriaceae bacterium UJ101]